MAYLFIPQPVESELPVFFNLEGVVGSPPAQNKREDVLFVQFTFSVIGKTPVSTSTPEFIAACNAVRVTGVIDEATIRAIRLMQTRHSTAGAIVDGRVSPAKGGAFYGASIYTIANLNNSLQNRNVDIWPRIDKIPGCPAELAEMVTRTVAGR